MRILFTCVETAGLLPDHAEGALPLRRALKVRVHLATCPACRALLASFRSLPQLLGPLVVEDAFEARGREALQAALARLGQPPAPRPWAGTPVPGEAQALLDAGGDLPLRLLASTHAALSRERAPLSTPHHLPEATLGHLPPEALWIWETDRDGLRRTELLADPRGGQRLFLVEAPAGSRLKAHRHLGSESLLVLSGALEEGGRRWAPGAWLHHGRGSSHGPSFPAGCSYLVREEGTIRIQGPSGWLRNARVG